MRTGITAKKLFAYAIAALFVPSIRNIRLLVIIPHAFTLSTLLFFVFTLGFGILE